MTNSWCDLFWLFVGSLQVFFAGFIGVFLPYIYIYIFLLFTRHWDWLKSDRLFRGSSHKDLSMQTLVLIGYWNSLVEHITIQLLSHMWIKYLLYIMWLYAMFCLHNKLYTKYVISAYPQKGTEETDGFTITSKAPRMDSNNHHHVVAAATLWGSKSLYDWGNDNSLQGCDIRWNGAPLNGRKSFRPTAVLTLLIGAPCPFT